MHRAPLLCVVALAAVTAASACGGGGGGRLSKEEYASKLGAICADYNKFEQTVARPTSIAGLKAYIDKVEPKLRDAIANAKKLKPPKDEQARVDEFLSIADQELDLFGQVKAAAKAGDTQKVQELASKGTALDKRSDTIARELGATDCTSS